MLDEKYLELKEIREKILDFQKKEEKISRSIKNYLHKHSLNEVNTKYGIIRLVNIGTEVLCPNTIDKSILHLKTLTVCEGIRLIKSER